MAFPLPQESELLVVLSMTLEAKAGHAVPDSPGNQPLCGRELVEAFEPHYFELAAGRGDRHVMVKKDPADDDDPQGRQLGFSQEITARGAIA